MFDPYREINVILKLEEVKHRPTLGTATDFKTIREKLVV